MNKLNEILKSSSLTVTMSYMEIEEISDEIETDLDNYLEEEKERIRDEVYEEFRKDEIVTKNEISKLKKEIAEMKKENPPHSSVADKIALQWVISNWDWIIKLEHLNKNAKEIYELALHGKNPQAISNDADEDILFNDSLIDKVKSIGLHKRIILCGYGASGKDHGRKLLENRGFKYGVSYTSRPPRTGETNELDYFFLSVEEFQRMIDNDEFYEYVTFNGWYYGTSKTQFYNDDIFIMTPHGISSISPEDRKNSFVIFFDIDEETRRTRLAGRSDSDTIERRLLADKLDFTDFTDFDMKITDPNF